MSDFFEKLKKGMDAENSPEDIPEEEPEEEEPVRADLAQSIPEQKPEVVLATTKKKTTRKKRIIKKEKPDKNKIEVKQGFILSEDNMDETDIFEKEGQLTVDVFETKDEVIIQSAVAGIDPNDLDISIEKDVVSIKGKRERKFEERAENFFYQECFWGRFSREIVLPSEVDKSKAEAVMKDGVLTIKIPKINKNRLNVNIEE